TRLYGMPDHVPIDVDIMRQYARCAVDSCAVNQKAVCWGKVNRQNPVMPTSPDSFNSNGFTNCQADGMAVSCDPPKLLPILPAVCLAKINTGNSTGYYDNYGKTLPAMSGKTYFQNTTLYVNTPVGFSVGQQLAGR
ncbi:MAG: hypothetical protein M3Y07_13020, partial [Acidobacteriota bacterium]|nr:hypothetical protein [Acidobacteriota bacterium]